MIYSTQSAVHAMKLRFDGLLEPGRVVNIKNKEFANCARQKRVSILRNLNQLS